MGMHDMRGRRFASKHCALKTPEPLNHWPNRQQTDDASLLTVHQYSFQRDTHAEEQRETERDTHRQTERHWLSGGVALANLLIILMHTPITHPVYGVQCRLSQPAAHCIFPFPKVVRCLLMSPHHPHFPSFFPAPPDCLPGWSAPSAPSLRHCTHSISIAYQEIFSGRHHLTCTVHWLHLDF